MLADHPPQAEPERLRRGFEALEQAGAQQPRRRLGRGRVVRVGPPEIRVGRVSGEAHEALPRVRIERVGHRVEQARRRLLQLVVDALGHGLREHDWAPHAVRADQHVVLVEALHEAARAPHRHRVDDGVEQVGAEVGRVLARGLAEALADVGHARLRQGAVLPQEIPEQLVEVPQAVVHRRGGEQDEALARPLHEAAQHLSPVW